MQCEEDVCMEIDRILSSRIEVDEEVECWVLGVEKVTFLDGTRMGMR
jgi:hypothetical protein